MSNLTEIKNHLEKLTGQKAPINEPHCSNNTEFFVEKGIDYGQLNELLLLFGYDRVTHCFFQFLVNGEFEYKRDSRINSLTDFKKGYELFHKMALHVFGSVKYAFKKLSRSNQLLFECMEIFQPRSIDDFRNRQTPVIELDYIKPDETYYLGYIVEREIKDKLKLMPEDAKVKKELLLMDNIKARGKKNHYAYLTSDHLDVYIATSMRQKHEYISVNRITQELFNCEELLELNLRWFDPTQAFCENRIDKGLSEALMLRRAKCTVYLAQETDTLGKDSELASTLAQGKTVIAYIPIGDKNYLNQLIEDLKSVNPQKSEVQLMLDQYQIFDSKCAWDPNDSEIRKWIENPITISKEKLYEKLLNKIKEHYDNRAKTLKSTHPLGIQVHLNNGVANGVLVVRNIKDCASLIRRIVLREMEFSLEYPSEKNDGCLLLKEKISDSIFRVVTSDETLTNSFWNFYIDPAE